MDFLTLYYMTKENAGEKPAEKLGSLTVIPINYIKNILSMIYHIAILF